MNVRQQKKKDKESRKMSKRMKAEAKVKKAEERDKKQQKQAEDLEKKAARLAAQVAQAEAAVKQAVPAEEAVVSRRSKKQKHSKALEANEAESAGPVQEPSLGAVPMAMPATASTDPLSKRGKKRKVAEATTNSTKETGKLADEAAEAVEEAAKPVEEAAKPTEEAARPAVAPKPAPVHEPKGLQTRKLTAKEKKMNRMQASLEKQHKALFPASGRSLLIGEGNFSFARALCRNLGTGNGVFATAFDSDAVLKRKYPDADECRKEIEEKFGGTTLTGVDATRLHEVREFRRAFRTICWNFPHIGSGEKDVEKSIGEHQRLLTGFFSSAAKCLSAEEGSTVHVAIKTCEPYKSWKVVQLVRAGCPELQLHSVVQFAHSAWPGYEHRRTTGFHERFAEKDSAFSAGSKVYAFSLKPSADDAA